MKLTEVEFWEGYWENCKLPSSLDMDFSFDRCLANALKENIPEISGEIFEVGCAPGRWLAFMATEFGLKPSGIEYSEAGMRATLKNFQLLNIEPGAILTGDFFQTKPNREFDVVISLGFIEHFDDPDRVVELHLQWLKPGGLLILGVPNFRGIYSLLQGILDKEILDKHNLNIMNLDYFSGLASRFSLELTFLSYLGSFEPALLIPNPKKTNLLQYAVMFLIRIALRVRKLKFLDKLNHRLFSSYILAVYKKGEDN